MPRHTAAPTPKSPRIEREKRTVSAMIDLYCADQHASASGQLCPDCADLRAYAMQRLDRCPFQENKTACVDCAIHCYRPDRREQMRAVMRCAGPRMLWTHPMLAIRHLLDGRRKTAALPPKSTNQSDQTKP